MFCSFNVTHHFPSTECEKRVCVVEGRHLQSSINFFRECRIWRRRWRSHSEIRPESIWYPRARLLAEGAREVSNRFLWFIFINIDTDGRVFPCKFKFNILFFENKKDFLICRMNIDIAGSIAVLLGRVVSGSIAGSK